MNEVKQIRKSEGVRSVKKKRRLCTDIDFELRSPMARKILLAVIAVLILTFCLYQIYMLRDHRVLAKTETALTRTISRTVDTDGFVLRAETVVNCDRNGTVVPCQPNGSKIGVGDTVARIYASPQSAEKYLEYSVLQDEIAYYQSISQVSGSSVPVGMEIYNANILSRLLTFEDTLEKNALSSLSAKMRELAADITRKQAAVGKPVDVEAKLSALTTRAESLQSQLAGCTEVPAEAAGYYVNETDGYESVGDYDAVTGISADGVRDLLGAKPKKAAKNVGKLITQFNWYLVCCVPADRIEGLEAGARVKIYFPDSFEDPLTMKVKAINPSENGEDVAVVFVSDLMDEQLASLRNVRIRIRIEEYTGYAVNKNALRTVNTDGKDEVGVYVQLGNIAKFRKVEIVYADDNVVLASNEKDENGYLRLYDEIITEGTDLYDGKIIA